MSLRDTWVQAKAASKVDFSKACKSDFGPSLVVKNNPATMKKTQDTPALHDIAGRMIPAPDAFHEAMLAAIAATEEYTNLIQASYKRWPDAKPDFRKPLIDALNDIEKTIGDRIKAGESGAG